MCFPKGQDNFFLDCGAAGGSDELKDVTREVASSVHFVSTHPHTQGRSLVPRAAKRTIANLMTLAEATAGNNCETVNLNTNII